MTVKSNHTNIVSNGYFLDHPERIIHTDAKRDTDPYGKPAMVYTHSGGVEGHRNGFVPNAVGGLVGTAGLGTL